MIDEKETLEMIKRLTGTPQTTPQLMAATGLSESAVWRRLKKARKLGVQLQSRQMETNERGRLTGPYYWELVNAREVQGLIRSLNKLQRSRS